MTWPSRVTRTVESFRVIGLQARVDVDHKKFHMFSTFFAMKWRPTCCKMAPDKLENGQCCFNKFDCRLFMSKFSQFALYLSLSFSVVSKSLTQPCCKSCSLSVSVVVNVGMCVKNSTYVARTSRNNMSMTLDLYCCLVPKCEALRTYCSAYPITKWCFDQDVKVVPGTTFTKRTCNRCGLLQKRGDVVATSRLALHCKCGFRMPNT